MKQLRPVGFFRELRHGMPNGPSLHDAQSPTAHTNEQKIVTYLRSGHLFIATPGIVRDVLMPAGPVIGSPHVMTDGEWAWPNDLPYYVGQYHVALPAEFIDHMEANDWMAAPLVIARTELALQPE
jgi:hypothetical protein